MDLTLKVGDLWTYAGRPVVICGNNIFEQETIWVMDWESGTKVDANVPLLGERNDKESISKDILISRFAEWAREGNSYAMWWLAWRFEGTNHHKSVWYYVAALRANPETHGWGHRVILENAHSAYMCKGIPRPNIDFLEDIPEMQGYSIGKDWPAAVKNAEMAIHIPHGTPIPDPLPTTGRLIPIEAHK